MGPIHSTEIPAAPQSMTPAMAIHQQVGKSQLRICLMQKLVEKGATQQAPWSQVHLASSMFIIPKSIGGWGAIIDLKLLNSFLEPQMEGLYMLPRL